ncbi:MAG TPA: PilT/PilU family type 4a pilus ATPase [Acidimicrobiales bacterium]|nr:PilT/PilU family type 4a pilus ATPase [Acidimicrobiales bacterium]
MTTVDRQRTRVLDEIDPWLETLWEARGTDFLLTAGAPPLVRIDGAMRAVEGAAPLTPSSVERIVKAVLGDALVTRYEQEREVDFAFAWQDRARLRGNAFHQRETCALSLRMIPYEIPSFAELGIPSAVERLVNLPQGLVIVTGPTGSGKSTTLAAMVDYINRHRSCHIVTIEDPIEYHHFHLRSAVTQREVGTDTESFERALRSALREDPDVLMIGEMRDLESIQTVLTIAETGHLVFASLHTNDSAQSIDRIIDVFPSDRRPQIEVQLAASLEGVIYQRLVPRRGGGMVAAYEVMMANHAVRNLLREGKTRQLRNVIATHQGEGMQTLEKALSTLVHDGVVDYDTALSVSLYPAEIGRPAPVVTVA